MLFVFLVDTSVSMEQALGASPGSRQQDEQAANEGLFGGDKVRISRRWQRKGRLASSGLHTNTRLDCAKSIVEQIVHNRESFDQDRYMLVTYSSSKNNGCIRSTLKDSRATLLSELSRIEAKDRYSGDESLVAIFDRLSLMRSAYDLDTYGYGRYPALNEQAHILWLTDGGSMVTASGVQNRLNLQVGNPPWAEAYVEPFRWDQRMTLVLLHKHEKALCSDKRHSSESALLPMCTAMGGSAHHVETMHQAQRFVESFVPSRAMLSQGRPQGLAMANPGVLVKFERIDDNPTNPGNTDLNVALHVQPCNVTSTPLPPPSDSIGLGRAGFESRASTAGSLGIQAMVAGHLGYFPIPEAFWPEVIAPPSSQQAPGASAGASGWQIQRRGAHPTLAYSQAGTEWAVPPQFPFDKYQIDTNSNVARKLLAAAQAAQTQHDAQGGRGLAKPVCWPVFVNGSYMTAKNAGFPFGILRPNTARTAVNLFVLPYNFTALWKILSKLDAQTQAQSLPRSSVAMSPAWRREFEEYLQHTPGYYAIPLKRAFKLYGIPSSVFPRSFGHARMDNVTKYQQFVHGVASQRWDLVQPAGLTEAATPADAAMNLQRALLSFDPASDARHLVTNAFDVDRAHCLATLSAMRRVFVRELMSGQGAYFRANGIIPPTTTESADDSATKDVDDRGVPRSPTPMTPPVASMEYSLFGYTSPGSGSPTLSPDGRSAFGVLGKRARGAEDTRSLEPGLDYSPLGGLVDVASEDDRDSRHSIPIREMGEYGPAMHRRRASEARDPLLDERTAQQQRKNMFGNPYRRLPREPRSPGNNVVAHNPELSAKLGLSRSGNRAPGPAAPTNSGTGSAKATEADDEPAGLEMESEAEVNELAIDKMFEDMPAGNDDTQRSNNTGGKFWWMQRRNIPRRRSINTVWRKNDDSWNVNPWAASSAKDSPDLGALTFTSDAVLLNRSTSQIIRTPTGAIPKTPPAEGAPQCPQPPTTSNSKPAGLGIVEGGAEFPAAAQEDPARDNKEGPVRNDREAPAAQPASVGEDSSMVMDVDSNAKPPGIASPTLAPAPTAKIKSPPQAKVNIAQERAWFLKHIKADPAHYDEQAVLQHLGKLQSNPSVTRPQLKVIVTAAIGAAKAMRRKQLVARLEQSGAL
ncbi:hypothetical protein GGF46_002558 [Coemansia sp. RSA 552]|nr:hypothetical protein GGF46_002558 [Coemansia sp. RSA 552]